MGVGRRTCQVSAENERENVRKSDKIVLWRETKLKLVAFIPACDCVCMRVSMSMCENVNSCSMTYNQNMNAEKFQLEE